MGSFTANGYGLQDMAGNVWEWCWDWYGAYASGAQTDPHGAASGSSRVSRGGGWLTYALYCRVADRDSGDPAFTYGHLGFRTARSSVLAAEGATGYAVSADGEVDTRYKLSSVAPTNGTISGVAAEGKYLTGTTATLTAVPAAGYVFTGWAGAASGTTNPLSVVMNSDMTIGATFTRQFTLASHPSSNGRITGMATDGRYLTGATATLTAVPDPGYAFMGWTGDATGTANPLALVMDSDKTIGADFGPDLSDSDNDGLANFDEVVTHGTNPLLPDTDGDGLTDGWEAGVGRFSIIAGSFTWNQAQAQAVTMGGYLATFTSAAEWAVALESLGAQALDPFVGLWLGATDGAAEGTWTWVTGEPFGFSNWAPGKPDNAGDADFAEVAGGLGEAPGTWHDRSAATTRGGYLLETGSATDPTARDTDGDGLSDGFESAANLNPLQRDSDGNGTPDGAEDADTDGLDNVAEQAASSSPQASDTDGDGLGDGAEVTVHHTQPTAADTDGDILTDGEEVLKTHTNPLVADSDSDGTPDGDDDQDADGYTNLQEVRLLLTDPLNGASRFTATLRVTPGGGTELALPTIAGRRYVILRSTGLTTWLVVQELIGTGAEIHLPLGSTAVSQKYFYKVAVHQN